MSFDPHSNFAYSVVAVAPLPAASGTTLVLSAGEGALFPAAPFNATIWPTGTVPLAANAEIVRVTHITGDSLTIVRAQEGTAARAIVAGDQIAATITAKVVTDIENAIPSTAGLISAVNVSAGTTSGNVAAVTFADGGGVTFGLHAGTLTASVETNYQPPGAYLTTAALSQDSSRYAGTNGAITGGSITVNTDGVSVHLPAYLTTWTAPSSYVEQVNGSSGALSLAVGSSLSSSTQGSSLTFGLASDITTALQPAGAYLTTAALSDHSHGTPTLALTNLSGSTASASNGFTLSLSAGDYLTTARASTDALGLNTAASNVTWTANSAGVSIDARGYAGTGTTFAGTHISASMTQDSQGLHLALSAGGAADGVNVLGVNGAATALSTTYVLSDSHNVTFGLSAGTITASASYAAQTTQTQNLHNVTLSGNTAGTLAQVSSGTLTLAGGNNITLSQAGNAITISGPTIGGAQTGISGIVVSDATYTSGTVVFSNAGHITIGSSVDGATQFVRLSGHPAQTTQSAIEGFGVSDTGNTAGATGISTGIDWVLAGSGSITLSQSTAAGANTIWVQHPAWLTTAALSGDSSNYAGTNAAMTGGSITVNTSGVSVHLPAYLTTARASTDAVGLNTAQTNVTWTVNSAGLSLNAGGYAGTGTSATNASLTLNSNGLAISVAAPSAADLNISAGTTSSHLTQLRFLDANGVSFGLDGVSLTATVRTDYQPAGAYLTTAALSQDSSKYAGTNGAITGGSITVNTSGVSIHLPAYLTAQTNPAFSASGGSSTFQTLSFNNAHGLTFSNVGGAIEGSYTVPVVPTSYLSQINGSSGAVSLAVGSSLSSSTNGSTITFGLASDITTALQPAGAYLTTARASTDAIGLATAKTNVTWTANSAGLSLDAGGYAGTTTAMAGGSVTLNSGGISLSLPAYLTTAALSNHSHGNPTLALTNLSGTTASASNGLTLSLSAGNYLTTARASTDAVGLNTAATNVTWTVNSSGVSLNAAGYAGTNTAITGGSVTLNSSGISINLPAYLTTADLSANSSKYVQEWALTGNAAGTTSSAQGTRLYLSGGNSLTISGNSNTLVFSVGNYLTTARASTDALGLATAATNVTWTANSAGVSLNAAGYAGTGFTSAGANVGISATHNTAGLNLSITAPAQSAQSAIEAFGVGTAGNTAGNTGLSTGIDWVLAGSGSITLSQSTAAGANTVWIQHPAWLTTAALSADSSKYAGTAGAITGGSLTVNTSGVSINLPAYLTTAALSNHSHGNPTLALTNLSGTTASASNGLTLSLSAGNYLTTARASTDAVGLNTAQTNVTWTVNSSGISLNAGGYAGTNTAITGGSVTLNSSGISINLPAYLTTADLSANSSKYMQEWALTGNTAGTTSSAQGTRLYLSGGNSLTISGNSNSIVFSVGAYLTTAAQSNHSHGNPTLALTNLSGTTASASNGLTLSLSAAAPGAAAENNWHAITGNTTGNTTASGSTIVLSGGNGVTLSGTNGSVVGIAVNTYSTVGTATTVYPIGTDNSVGTVTRWAAEDHQHAGQIAEHFVAPWLYSGRATNSSLGQSTIYFQPFDLGANLDASRLNFYVSISGAMSAGNSTGTCSAGIGYALYTLATGSDSRTLSLLTSYSLQLYSLSFTSNTRFAATHYAGLSNATSHSTVQTAISSSNATTYLETNLNGPRVVAMPLGMTLTPGRYYLGMSVQTVSGNAMTNALSVQHTHLPYVQPAVYPMGQASGASNASVFNAVQGWGNYSAQTGAFPATLAFTTDHIRANVTRPLLIPFEILGYGTSTNII